MALPLLTPSDVGAPAREKINTAISQTDAAAAKADAAVRSAPPSSHRPGDGIRAFTFVSSLAQLGGEADALAPLGSSLIAFAAGGGVVRLVGQGILAAREAEPLEPGRIREVRAAFRRRANASDPSNDTIRTGVLWLDQAKSPLPGPAFSVVTDLDSLTTASGRQEVKAYIAASAGEGITIVAPAGAAYFRRFVFNFGFDGVTDVETLAGTDVTGLSIPPVVTTDALNRIAAQESVNAGSRLAALESALQNPNSVTFATRTDAAAAQVPTTVTSIVTRGRAQAGDGGGADYLRSTQAQAQATGDWFRSQDGAYWGRVSLFSGDRLFDGPMTSATAGVKGGSLAFPSMGPNGSPGPVAFGQNTRAVFHGSASAPKGALYAVTADYVEAHFGGQTGFVNDYGNPTRIGARVTEVLVADTFTGEANAITGRIRRLNASKGTEGYNQIVVFMSGHAEVGAPAGQPNDDAWFGNGSLAHVSGKAPGNLVGWEIDLVHVESVDVGTPPGTAVTVDGVTRASRNYCGYWAQADGFNGAVSGAAFYASYTPRSGGWDRVLYADLPARSWLIDLNNRYNDPKGGGMRIGIQSVNQGAKLAEFAVGTPGSQLTIFRLDDSLENPLQLQIGSSLRRLKVHTLESIPAGSLVVCAE